MRKKETATEKQMTDRNAVFIAYSDIQSQISCIKEETREKIRAMEDEAGRRIRELEGESRRLVMQLMDSSGGTPDDDMTLNSQQIADILQVKKPVVLRLMHEGKLKGFQADDRCSFGAFKKDVLEYIARCMVTKDTAYRKAMAR